MLIALPAALCQNWGFRSSNEFDFLDAPQPQQAADPQLGANDVDMDVFASYHATPLTTNGTLQRHKPTQLSGNSQDLVDRAGKRPSGDQVHRGPGALAETAAAGRTRARDGNPPPSQNRTLSRHQMSANSQELIRNATKGPHEELLFNPGPGFAAPPTGARWQERRPARTGSQIRRHRMRKQLGRMCGNFNISLDLFSHVFISAAPRRTRRVTCSTWCP